MGLEPLEFSACLTDSPYFRENLHQHEKELERTSKAIKALIAECKDLLQAAKNLNKAQMSFSKMLKEFRFDCIGSKQTDDEKTIAASLERFGDLIADIETERKRMLDQAYEHVIVPLETFRKEQIGKAKEGKKKFDKQTTKFCQILERHLNLKHKTSTTEQQHHPFQEADAQLDFERRQFYQESMKYVLSLQEVQERKKFEFVETLLTFMYRWLTFYHVGHDVAGEFKPYMTDLQLKLQKCRDNFQFTHEEAEQLMQKMLEVRGTKPNENIGPAKNSTREGYVYLMEKKALVTTWTKYYCVYDKKDQSLTLIPYNQVAGKGIQPMKMNLTSCTRRAQDSIEKRFCFDITIADRATSLTLQALSEEDRRCWLDVMDGKEPIYSEPSSKNADLDRIRARELNNPWDALLDDIGFAFIRHCISAIEDRGLDDQGLYRVVGVNSKVTKLTSYGLDRRKMNKLNLHEDGGEWEVKTITSALKNYFRSLPQPLMTYSLHQEFIAAAKQEVKTLRVNDIHRLVHQLPEANFEMLEILMMHLKRVADNSKVNLMNVANIGVCFGPTLMRPEEETMAAIMDIKFCNIVVEILINHYEQIFKTSPEGADITETRVAPPTNGSQNNSQPLPSPRMHRKPPNITVPTAAQNNANTVAPLPESPASRIDLSGTGPPPPSASSTSSSGSFGSISSSTPGLNQNPQQGQTYAMVRAKLRPTTGFYSQFSPVWTTSFSGEHHSSNSSSSESLNSKTSSHHQSNPTISTTNHSASSTPSMGKERSTPQPIYGNVGQVVYRHPRLRAESDSGRHAYFANGVHRGLSRAVHSTPSSATSLNKTPDPIGRQTRSAESSSQLSLSDSSNRMSVSLTSESKHELKGSSSTSSISSLSSNPNSANPGRTAPLPRPVPPPKPKSPTDASAPDPQGRCNGQLSTTKIRVRTLYSCAAENESELSFEPNQIIHNVRQSREPGWLEGTLDHKRGLIPANYVEFLN